jgi:dsDNA-specific endonuclease/ATPase MutS2
MSGCPNHPERGVATCGYCFEIGRALRHTLDLADKRYERAKANLTKATADKLLLGQQLHEFIHGKSES